MSRLKKQLLTLLPNFIILAFSGLRFVLDGRVLKLRRKVTYNQRHTQMVAQRLLTNYQHLSAWEHEDENTVTKHEIGIYSQNGEDGILLHLFSILGCHDCRFVEFGVGDGSQCNTANLSINFGWKGLLMEADSKMAKRAALHYQQWLGSYAGNVNAIEQLVTPANINQILEQNGFQGEIDLLSIDIDGNDYWVWEAITTINPRVVVIEYNASFGDTRSLVTVYDDNFDKLQKHPSGFYEGASLAALARLGREKGYALVGCESTGVNAFFVRQDLIGEKLIPLPVSTAYRPHYYRTKIMTVAEQWRAIEHMPYQEV